MQAAAIAAFGTDTSSPDLPDDEDNEDEDYFATAFSDAKPKRLITNSHQQQQLEKTQSLLYIKIAKPGDIRLERILDASNTDVRISRGQAGSGTSGAITTVVECPSARFEDIPVGGDVECEGAEREVFIRVRGTVPMSLSWERDVKGKKEVFTVEGIEGSSAEVRCCVPCAQVQDD